MRGISELIRSSRYRAEGRSDTTAQSNAQIRRFHYVNPSSEDLYVEDVNKLDHAHDTLDITEQMKSKLSQETLNNLDMVRAAFTGLNFKAAMLIPDNFINLDEKGYPKSVSLYACTEARNKNAFLKDTTSFSQRLNETFSSDNKDRLRSNSIVTLSEIAQGEDGLWSTFSIFGQGRLQLPINLHLLQVKNIDKEIKDTRESAGDTFIVYRMKGPEKLSIEEMSLEEKSRYLTRDPEGFFDNLAQADYDTVKRILDAIGTANLDGITQEVLVIAEGSATTGRNYRDIDLRILFSPIGKNDAKELEEDPTPVREYIQESLRESFKKRKLRAKESKNTTYLKTDPFLGISYEDEDVEESFIFRVPETRRHIQLVIANFATPQLNSIYNNAPGRTDFPVILDRLNEIVGTDIQQGGSIKGRKPRVVKPTKENLSEPHGHLEHLL